MKFQARLFFALLLCASAFPQGVRYDVPPILNSRAVLVPNANISLCPGTATITNSTCSPASTQAFTDITLTTPCATGSPVVLPQTSVCQGTADALGNAGFWLAPGAYIYCINGPTITGKCYNLTVPAGLTSSGGIILGSGNTFSPVTFSNHNNIFWAGPGPTPTIDQAVAQCTSLLLPCFVEISPGYTGPESTNLLTISTGDQVYSGALNVTVNDRRGITSGSGTNYPILYGARLSGQLVRLGANLWVNNAIGSTAAATAINWIQGNMAASAGKAMNGQVGVVVSHDSIIQGTADNPWVGTDGECDITATSADVPVRNCYGINGQANIIRTNATQSITNGIGLHGAVNANQSSTAQITNSYGAYLEAQIAGSSRNYSLYTLGNNLMANETQLHVLVQGASFTIANSPTGATESGQTVTITTTGVCPFVTGQEVIITGVGVSGYNSPGGAVPFSVLSPGCNGGSTFTYVNPFQASLAASGGGSVLGRTPQNVAYYRNTNSIEYRPLSNTQGWEWLSQGGAGWFHIDQSQGIISRIIHTFQAGISLGNIFISNTVPTIAAAGCGGAAASIVVANGTAAFKVNVGTTPGSACTLTFPAAVTGWNVTCNDITTQSTSVFVQKQTGAESTTSVTITNFSDVAAATAFVGSDILKCTAFAD